MSDKKLPDKWISLLSGKFKVNFDGAKLRDWGHVWGFMARDGDGRVRMAGVKQGPGFLDPSLEKARACIFAIRNLLRSG